MATTTMSRMGDAIAISLSGLCLIHCLALPLIAVALPLAGAWAQAEWVHWLFVAIAAPVSVFTLSRPHPKGLPWPSIGLAVVGVALLVAGAAEFPSASTATAITVVGGLFLATAHLLNWRRSWHHAHDPGHAH